MRRSAGAVLALALFAGPALAADLDGAWATNADNCAKIFVKKGNQVSLAEDSDVYGTGFVLDGNKMRGKIAQCTIKSRKKDGNTFKLVAGCSTDVMLQAVSFDVQMIDDNTLKRLWPGDADMGQTFYRCKI